jgi:hypothetical protein
MRLNLFLKSCSVSVSYRYYAVQITYATKFHSIGDLNSQNRHDACTSIVSCDVCSCREVIETEREIRKKEEREDIKIEIRPSQLQTAITFDRKFQLKRAIRPSLR